MDHQSTMAKQADNTGQALVFHHCMQRCGSSKVSGFYAASKTYQAVQDRFLCGPVQRCAPILHILGVQLVGVHLQDLLDTAYIVGLESCV